MNQEHRESIQEMIDQLEALSNCLVSLLCDVEEERDDLPEALQESEAYEQMEEACDNLTNASESLVDVIGYLEDAMN